MLKFLGKIIEIAVTNFFTLLAYHLLYGYLVVRVPGIQQYGNFPLYIIVIFLIYQDVKILFE